MTRGSSSPRQRHGWLTGDGDDGSAEIVRARLVVNAAGPWVDHVLSTAMGQNDVHNVRLVQGSHIVV